jgi:hypothetical protein
VQFAGKATKASSHMAVIALLILTGVCFSQSASHPASTMQRSVPGLQSSPPPWAAELTHLGERLDAIGFPKLPWGDMNLTLHTHQHLDIFVHGKPITVPANLGISSAPKFLSPLHTHDATGVIHVESPTIETFTLGQFFDVWGVRFTSRCLGADCAKGKDKIQVFLNGKLFKDDPRRLPLLQHQEIVVTFGNAKELPRTIPASYTFPAGL